MEKKCVSRDMSVSTFLHSTWGSPGHTTSIVVASASTIPVFGHTSSSTFIPSTRGHLSIIQVEKGSPPLNEIEPALFLQQPEEHSSLEELKTNKLHRLMPEPHFSFGEVPVIQS
ncbi:hypothetical protein HPG69_007686 [Diceros bicornis minor]|uniref:Uncharacterized protein n=1 Tax=Diceros bicornis minor TaxID=77932 RepID=A0A7J7EBB8_DICBM|nr:hypothetical protein HPG69_007686 [Diceros bicornis minor]